MHYVPNGHREMELVTRCQICLFATRCEYIGDGRRDIKFATRCEYILDVLKYSGRLEIYSGRPETYSGRPEYFTTAVSNVLKQAARHRAEATKVWS